MWAKGLGKESSPVPERRPGVGLTGTEKHLISVINHGWIEILHLNCYSILKLRVSGLQGDCRDFRGLIHGVASSDYGRRDIFCHRVEEKIVSVLPFGRGGVYPHKTILCPFKSEDLQPALTVFTAIQLLLT